MGRLEFLKVEYKGESDPRNREGRVSLFLIRALVRILECSAVAFAALEHS